MIEEGLAKEYTYNKAYKYQKEFKQAEEKAKELKK
jgi:endonuclease YncB( thermonuclease family)